MKNLKQYCENCDKYTLDGEIYCTHTPPGRFIKDAIIRYKLGWKTYWTAKIPEWCPYYLEWLVNQDDAKKS